MHLDRQSGHTPLTQRMEEILGSTPRSVSSAVRSPKWHLCTPREGTGRTGETGRTGGKIFAPVPGSSAEIQESPREWIRNIERLRNPDTVASLLRPPELTRKDVESIQAGQKDDVERLKLT